MAVGAGECAVSRAVRGTRPQERPVRLHMARVHVPLSAILGAWLLRQVGRLLSWLVSHVLMPVLRRPLLLLPILASVVTLRLTSGHMLPMLLGLLTSSGAALAVWWWRWRDSFIRQVVWALRGCWRGQAVYRFAWQPAMVTTGLAVHLNGAEYLPKLLGVSSTGCVDRVRVQMLPGQVFEDWSTRAERLAQTFGAQECRVRTTRTRHRLELWFLIDDPLTSPIPHPPGPTQLPSSPPRWGLAWTRTHPA